MLLPTAILRHPLRLVPQPLGALQQHPISMVRRERLPVAPHLLPHLIQTLLELAALAKEGQIPPLGPLAAHEILRLQARAPVDRAAAAEARARGDGHGPVVRLDGAAALKHVGQARGLRQGEVGGVKVAALFEDEDVEGGAELGGQAVGDDAGAAARAEDGHVGGDLDGRGWVGRRTPSTSTAPQWPWVSW